MGPLLVFAVILPFAALIATLFWQNKNEKQVGQIVRFAKILNTGLALYFAGYWAYQGFQPVDYHWITLYHTHQFTFAIQFYYDEITAVFSVTGAILFFLVATFSKYYLHRDQGFKRYFTTILLFSFAYNLIVFSGNFETLFIGWEIKGICSFILIAFYRDRYLPVRNAFKAVSNYRISDVSLMLAMWMMHHLMHGNISFSGLENAKAAAAAAAPVMTVLIVCMLILPAAVKSAQFPFSTWLPRALEGPTSSSAIFYGSLSVHIGIFLLLRTHPFWEDLLWAKILIIVTGAITAFTATVMARVQPTVKTQIAYSSAAQIGLMFIEVALGFHWLVLLHFAGNAFLRTYQLLVSPSVLNYLVHHQLFHYTAPESKPVSRLQAAFYVLGIKEWNLDSLLNRYGWQTLKKAGRFFQFFAVKPVYIIVLLLAVTAFALAISGASLPVVISAWLPETCLALAFAVLLFAFTWRGHALIAWHMLPTAHLLLMAAILFNSRNNIPLIEILFYASGVLLAWIPGVICLNRMHQHGGDISLSSFHGYVYEQEKTGFVFLLAAIGMLGFPITAAFIGIDVLFTYIGSKQYLLISLMAGCMFLVEMAAFRILIRIFFGPHKQLTHPVAFRST